MKSKTEVLEKLVVYECENNTCKAIVEHGHVITKFSVFENKNKYFCSIPCVNEYNDRQELLKELELFLRLATDFCRPEKAETFFKMNASNRSTYFYHTYTIIKEIISGYLDFTPEKLSFNYFLCSTLFINTSEMVDTLVSKAKSSNSSMPDKHFLIAFSDYLKWKLTKAGKIDLARQIEIFNRLLILA
ncbi:MAG: hypothetical protein ACTSP4_00075 [Candidatus Hodarchaeales archaeon]